MSFARAENPVVGEFMMNLLCSVIDLNTDF